MMDFDGKPSKKASKTSLKDLAKMWITRNSKEPMSEPKKVRVKFVKTNFEVRQKNLTAQWAFPVSRFEEFLGVFQNSVYKVAETRFGVNAPIDNPEGENHPTDARIFVSGMDDAILSAKQGFRSSPGYCEVDYFFWIIKGWVCFGCVLPSTEKVDTLAYYKFKGGSIGVKWVKLPWEVKVGFHRLSCSCPDGVIPTYAKMLSFKPGEMVGVQELANRMVKNPKERVWAIQYVLQQRSLKIQKDRIDDQERIQRDSYMRSGGAYHISIERRRQMVEENHTSGDDDFYVKQELRLAALCYAKIGVNKQTPCPRNWPWLGMFWKPSDNAITNLVKAGALIAAEIDRLDRVRIQ